MSDTATMLAIYKEDLEFAGKQVEVLRKKGLNTLAKVRLAQIKDLTAKIKELS